MGNAVKKFFQDIELSHMVAMPNAEFAAKFPGVKGKRNDSFSVFVGSPIDCKAEWNGTRWVREQFPVERMIEYKANPSKHKCDARCESAKGFKCECECGGKNHGKLACN